MQRTFWIIPLVFTVGLAFVFDFVSAAFAQTPPAPVVSPEVQSDNRVTFRFRAPNANEVSLSLEGAPKDLAMQKDEQGVWSVTSEPLTPDFYGYAFVADGVHLIDPSNPLMKPNLLNTTSQVHVPGPGLPWEVVDVPHGEIHHHFYKSTVVGDQRDFYVYTPPGYDARGKQSYPVLYLLHGFSDDASGWTAVGRANVILDNLIAQGKTKPMLVVMTLGYGAPEILRGGFGGFSRNPEVRDRNFAKFSEALLGEVLPRVESAYLVNKDRNSRAIAGLSMGGSESLLTGLNNLDKFAWVGAFSSGGIPEEFDKDFPKLDAKANNQLKLLWIACGVDDRLIELNRKLRSWLEAKGVHKVDIETPGAHTWMVWRRNLVAFSGLLFR
jgi:enterochelin esterase-like enzyme